jgi:hypothetical protein
LLKRKGLELEFARSKDTRAGIALRAKKDLNRRERNGIFILLDINYHPRMVNQNINKERCCGCTGEI